MHSTPQRHQDAEPYDHKCRLLCFNELPYQLLMDVRAPLPAQPEKLRREDYEYARKGTCNVCLALEPQTGKQIGV